MLQAPLTDRTYEGCYKINLKYIYLALYFHLQWEHFGFNCTATAVVFHIVFRTVLAFIMSWYELFYTLLVEICDLYYRPSCRKCFHLSIILEFVASRGVLTVPFKGCQGDISLKRKATRTCRGNSSYIVARLIMHGAVPPLPLRSIRHQLIKGNDDFTFLWRIFKIISLWLEYFRKIFFIYMSLETIYVELRER
jgi:hypothetical protein